MRSMPTYRLVLPCASLAALLPAFCAGADGANLRRTSHLTPAATAELATLCPGGNGYPSASRWSGGRLAAPASATSGTPRIDQYRQGRRIASYTSFADHAGCTQAGDGTDYLHPAAPAASGCGPFTRSHSWRLWAPGDRFLVYPAVYTGEENQPWFGAQYDGPRAYEAHISHTPDNITVQGVVQNGRRPVILLRGGASSNTLGQAPVYFDVSTGITMDNINVAAGEGASVGKAAVYEAGASNLTLSHMRVTGFSGASGNGVFGAGEYTGTLTLTEVELDHDGGTNGPAHNAYIGASRTDPNFTVIMQRSWSHDAFYGHLFKSRAQNNVFIANLFEGGLPFGDNRQAENYLLDVPNGGRLTVRNNIFIKNRSGDGSNGMSLTYLMEGRSDDRPHSVDVENNTFVTLAATWDGSHPNFPMAFLYPNIRPDGPAWPKDIPTRIARNAFVGYCPTGDGPKDYRGDSSLTESFLELSPDFSLTAKVAADEAALGATSRERGTPAYTKHYGEPAVRQAETIGAED